MVREKFRYIVFTTHYNTAITPAIIHKGIHNSANSILSDWEYAMTMPKLKIAEYYPHLGIGIIKVFLSGVESIQKIFRQMIEVNDLIIRCEIIRTTGIIRKAKKWILKNKAIRN
ncbi:hypothetical protein NEPAR06_0589 [Nematocida parisii]|uniref:Uncharacterized protein n=1 Tax=Nematocida parisii (strain ERTm3) TaxID=935791 RepID=I3EI42_NEMP3|nr:uncharacterized protein NEPG_01900 [Nematocida parisii ERTm1]EIJ88889.1 hypothetical protein NEQG_00708 [Nematocida parisii ERTm3]KAI5126270.1 hypothetical protein NEPAR08_0341 [Nematocida parisii]EIJ93558.1 hypothetical protein NEPG_01900 [Nematocida parisii ERTm1]KAI5127137.1 hypothetical protein NEPAR03_0804 [Nematocida parisii]KAI5140145.1 hypothetical protein NEPAR04_0119 [Nematocida parisii]|eukprot:XP_013059728.1 hypothetical protein NEPG_01900 [Nematocida parisii ERTm1]